MLCCWRFIFLATPGCVTVRRQTLLQITLIQQAHIMTEDSPPLLQFFIFSFNRGEFLQNCVESIRLCAPGSAVTIWDDNSTDKLTRELLAILPDTPGLRVNVRQPALDESGDRSKHGGLYNNLQSACLSAPGNSLICCIQDDMQLVRPISVEEIVSWKTLLDSGVHRGFIQPAFLKTKSAETVFVPEKNAYHINRQHRSAGAWYSDVFMISTQVLSETGWQFKSRESQNEQQARQHLDQMVYLKNPFVAWLPGAPAWRGKRRTLAMRWAEKSRRCGFYPFKIMSTDDATAFCRRSHELLPLAESCLELRGGECGTEHSAGINKPWFYYPLQNKRGLKLLNKIELLLK